jgi:hypothetical protein
MRFDHLADVHHSPVRSSSGSSLLRLAQPQVIR